MLLEPSRRPTKLSGGEAGVGFFDEDNADAILVLLAAGVAVDDSSAKGKHAGAVLIA